MHLPTLLSGMLLSSLPVLARPTLPSVSDADAGMLRGPGPVISPLPSPLPRNLKRDVVAESDNLPPEIYGGVFADPPKVKRAEADESDNLPPEIYGGVFADPPKVKREEAD